MVCGARMKSDGENGGAIGAAARRQPTAAQHGSPRPCRCQSRPSISSGTLVKGTGRCAAHNITAGGSGAAYSGNTLSKRPVCCAPLALLRRTSFLNSIDDLTSAPSRSRERAVWPPPSRPPASRCRQPLPPRSRVTLLRRDAPHICEQRQAAWRRGRATGLGSCLFEAPRWLCSAQ